MNNSSFTVNVLQSWQNATNSSAPAWDPHSESEAAIHWQLLLYSGALFSISGALFIWTFIRRWQERRWQRLEGRNEVDTALHSRLLMCVELSAFSSLWFAFSVSLVVYNKWLLHYWRGSGFEFPVTISCFHMFLKLGLSSFVVRVWQRRLLPRLSFRNYIRHAIPVGVATALDVGASNASFMFITVSFYTVVKSSSLLFTLIFSVLWKLESCKLSLTLITLITSGGVCMVSFGQPVFNTVGFALVLGASAMGGLRWARTQLLMQCAEFKSDSDDADGAVEDTVEDTVDRARKPSTMETIFFISPASALTLVPFAIWLEASELLESPFLHDGSLVALVLVNMVGSGVFAFAMIYVELALLSRTSPLTLSIIGYLKQVLQVVLSIFIFDDQLTTLNSIGMFVTILGMGAYAVLKNDIKGNEKAGCSAALRCCPSKFANKYKPLKIPTSYNVEVTGLPTSTRTIVEVA